MVYFAQIRSALVPRPPVLLLELFIFHVLSCNKTIRTSYHDYYIYLGQLAELLIDLARYSTGIILSLSWVLILVTRPSFNVNSASLWESDVESHPGGRSFCDVQKDFGYPSYIRPWYIVVVSLKVPIIKLLRILYVSSLVSFLSFAMKSASTRILYFLGRIPTSVWVT